MVYQAGSRLVLLGGDFFSRRLNDAYADILNILHISMPKDFQVKCFITVHIGGGILPSIGKIKRHFPKIKVHDASCFPY
ncbi:MAG: hypothetical protein ACI9LX_000997 [Paraglaciecola sp.]